MSAAYAFLTALRGPLDPSHTVTLVGRPGSPVAHLYVGPRTPSGFAPRRGRPVCRAHTRRLTILENPSGVLTVAGRRVCARCIRRAAVLERRHIRLVSRDDHAAAYAGATMRDLVNANELVTSTDESHRVGYLASVLFSPPPVRLTSTTPPDRVALFYLHQRITRTRDRCRALERTPEERAAAVQAREANVHATRQAVKAHRQDAAAIRANDRRARGQYLAPWERA